MNGSNVTKGRADVCGVVVTEGIEDGAYRRMCRLVNVCMLATFLREFPLTYFTEEERRIFSGFESYIVHLENELYLERGLY